MPFKKHIKIEDIDLKETLWTMFDLIDLASSEVWDATDKLYWHNPKRDEDKVFNQENFEKLDEKAMKYINVASELFDVINEIYAQRGEVE